MNTENTQNQSLAAEIDSILRSWAHAQAPERDFSDYRVGVFARPVTHREGVFFAPGELALFRPAAVVAAEGATVRRPVALWSFELGREVMVPASMITAEAPVPPVELEADEASEGPAHPGA